MRRTRRKTAEEVSADNRRRHLNAQLAKAATPRDEFRAASDALLAEAIRLGFVRDITRQILEDVAALRTTPADDPHRTRSWAAQRGRQTA